MNKRRTLGRGLASLIPGADVDAVSSLAVQPDASPSPPSTHLLLLPVERIVPNPFQPRLEFDEAALAELTASIREVGVLQPLVVRPVGDRYELIAGERRLRASRAAGLKEVPVVLRTADDLESFELALIENIQRDDLNAIELARAFKQLQDEFHYTQEQISRRVGKERSTVTNHLRLLKLSESAKAALSRDEITMGHARALLGLEDPEAQERALLQVRERGLSVRETEALVGRMKDRPSAREKPRDPEKAEVIHVTDRLRRTFQTHVELISGKKGSGEIRIRFFSQDELNRILELFPEP